MGRQAAIPKRKNRPSEQPSSRSSGSSSSSEEEQAAPLAHSRNLQQEVEDESDDNGSDSDSETENALFRPVQSHNVEEDESDEEDASDDDEVEAEDDAEVPAAPATSKPSPTKPSDDSHNVDMDNEIAKKTDATVYVEGIPYKADEGDLVTHFTPCGIVKEVRMPRYQDSGRPRGYAHVVFEQEKSVAKALKLDGKYLMGRYLTIKRAERPRSLEIALKQQQTVKKPVKGCRTVFIKQLPYDIEEATLREALSTCGTVVSVRLPVWNHTKKLKGFGYVEFAKEDEAVAAVKRSGMKIGDRMVLISLDTAGGPKASFRTRDGRYWNKAEEGKQSLARKMAEKRTKSSHGAKGTKKPRTK